MIVLLGFMGVGKTTVAGCLGAPIYDMDTLLVERMGMPIADFFLRYGEPAFRREESRLLEELLSQQTEGVLSTGGGVIVTATNRQLLKQHRAHKVWLTASFEEVCRRIESDQTGRRPLFLQQTREEFHRLYETRQSLYEGVADLVIQTDRLAPEEIAQLIRQSLVAEAIEEGKEKKTASFWRNSL